MKAEHFSLLRPDNYQSADSTYSMLMPGEPGVYVMQIVPDDKKGKLLKLSLSYSLQGVDLTFIE